MDSSWLNGTDLQWLKPTQPDRTFLVGMELGMRMRHQRINEALAVREMESKVKLMDSQARLRDAEITAYEQMSEGNAELATALSQTAGRWTTPEAKSQFWGIAARYPQVMKSPQFKELVDNFQLADQAEARKQILDAQITGRSDLENLRAQNRESLLHEKYDRLSELQEDSQEARTLRDEIGHLNKMTEQAARPSATGANMIDLPWTQRETMKAELAAITRDPFNMSQEEKAKRIEGVYRKYKGIAAENTAKRPVASAPAAKILKFNPDTGKFE